MQEIESSIVTEIHVITRKYSPIRHEQFKWRIEQKDRDTEADNFVEFVECEADILIQIHFPVHTDFYRVSDIMTKIAIKRNPEVF